MGLSILLVSIMSSFVIRPSSLFNNSKLRLQFFRESFKELGISKNVASPVCSFNQLALFTTSIMYFSHTNETLTNQLFRRKKKIDLDLTH